MPCHHGYLVNAKPRQTYKPDDDNRAAPAAKGGRHSLVIAAILLAVTGGGSYAVWQQVRGHVIGGEEYRIDPDKIVISPPPAWIRSDVKAEVIRDATFAAPLSLLDGDLTVRMATAFAAHPWVAHVERVSKHYPAGLDVVLTYREPVAMVEVEEGTAALPVDAEGVVLPTDDFAPADAEAYPRIGEIHTAPSGPVGSNWGDARVIGAAQIAAALAGDWQALGVVRIVPGGQRPGRTGVEYVFDLVTAAGTQIRWGRAPGSDLSGELPAAEKILQLKRYAAQNNNSLEATAATWKSATTAPWSPAPAPTSARCRRATNSRAVPLVKLGFPQSRIGARRLFSSVKCRPL